MRRLGLIGLVACAGAPGPAPPPPACADAWVTWENFARPQLDTWCTPCHGAAIVGADRQGAPPGVDFDTWEDAGAWADRIAARVRDGSMPPAGGPTDEERGLLAEWAECGAPGEPTTPVPGDPCLPEVAFGGDEAPADLCATHNAVAGDLEVPEGLDVSCLCRVGGDLRMSAEVTTVVAPRLREIGGALDGSGAVALERLELVGLREVGGALRVVDAPALSTLWLDRVERVGGDYELARLPALVDWRGAQSPRSIGGAIRLVDLDALAEIDAFGRVEALGGDVVFSDNDGATAVFGLHVLTVVPGRVEITGNDRVSLIETLPDAVTIGGSLTVADHPELTAISGLAFLEELGSLSLTGNPKLDGFALPGVTELDGLALAGTRILTGVPGLSTLTAVKGELALRDNAALAELDGLHGLRGVGALVVTDNPSLSQAEIDDWLARIPDLGSVELSGNGR